MERSSDIHVPRRMKCNLGNPPIVHEAPSSGQNLKLFNTLIHDKKKPTEVMKFPSGSAGLTIRQMLQH